MLNEGQKFGFSPVLVFLIDPPFKKKKPISSKKLYSLLVDLPRKGIRLLVVLEGKGIRLLVVLEGKGTSLLVVLDGRE